MQQEESWFEIPVEKRKTCSGKLAFVFLSWDVLDLEGRRLILP